MRWVFHLIVHFSIVKKMTLYVLKHGCIKEQMDGKKSSMTKYVHIQNQGYHPRPIEVSLLFAGGTSKESVAMTYPVVFSTPKFRALLKIPHI